MLSAPSESDPDSSVGCVSVWCRLLSAPLSDDPSSQTEKRIGVNECANHFILSPIWDGSNMPVCTRRKARLVGVNDHSARNSTAWVREKLFKKSDALGRERRKLLIWNATTGRGYSRSVRVCSEKLASTFCELKNRTIATRVAISTESTSFPKIICDGLTLWWDGGGGAPDALENEFRWLEWAEPAWYGTLKWGDKLVYDNRFCVLAGNDCVGNCVNSLLYGNVAEAVTSRWHELLVCHSLIVCCHRAQRLRNRVRMLDWWRCGVCGFI